MLSRGHRITRVRDGEQRALAELQAGAFDLVLMDVLMPGLDGLRRRRWRARGRGTAAAHADCCAHRPGILSDETVAGGRL
jgi:CheY-like chemotaxis protein